jgi:hypothetical protein
VPVHDRITATTGSPARLPPARGFSARTAGSDRAQPLQRRVTATYDVADFTRFNAQQVYARFESLTAQMSPQAQAALQFFHQSGKHALQYRFVDEITHAGAMPVGEEILGLTLPYADGMLNMDLAKLPLSAKRYLIDVQISMDFAKEGPTFDLSRIVSVMQHETEFHVVQIYQIITGPAASPYLPGHIDPWLLTNTWKTYLATAREYGRRGLPGPGAEYLRKSIDDVGSCLSMVVDSGLSVSGQVRAYQKLLVETGWVFQELLSIKRPNDLPESDKNLMLAVGGLLGKLADIER